MSKRTHAIWTAVLLLSVLSAALTGYQSGVWNTQKPIHVHITQSEKVTAPVHYKVLAPSELCIGDYNDNNWLYPAPAIEWKYMEGGMSPYRVTCG